VSNFKDKGLGAHTAAATHTRSCVDCAHTDAANFSLLFRLSERYQRFRNDADAV
jgi:hypothetical protein